MKKFAGLLTIAIALIFAAPVFAADAKPHRVAFHVDQNDPAIMNLVLNNATNLMEYYHGKGDKFRSRSSPTDRACTCCAKTPRR